MACLECFNDRAIHFYLILSRDCNLKCRFCYQPEKFRGKQKMSVKTAEDSMNWIFDNFGDSDIKVMLWGGEPFINPEAIDHLLSTYPQIRFTVVTNGYLITEDIKNRLLKYKNNLFFSVSVANYRKEYPDFMERLAPALELVVKNGGDVHYVSDDPKTVYEDYLKLDKMGVPLIRISFPRNTEVSNETLVEMEAEWKRIVDHAYFEKDFHIGKTNFDKALRSNIKNDIKGIPFDIKQPYFCGCGFNYMSIDTAGDIYPCDWFCGLGEFNYGNIYTGFNAENVRRMHQLEKNNLKTYQEFCVGKNCGIPSIHLCPRAMCLAENLEIMGDVGKPQESYCKINALEYRVGRYLVERAIKDGKFK